MNNGGQGITLEEAYSMLGRLVCIRAWQNDYDIDVMVNGIRIDTMGAQFLDVFMINGSGRGNTEIGFEAIKAYSLYEPGKIVNCSKA